MNRVFMKRAGLALLRRPWASRLALAWGLRRALRSARGIGRMSFLGGVGVGAGLMYLIAGRGSQQPPTRRAAPRRTPTAGRTPAPRRASGSPRAKTR
jgi:hypothetical protein